MREVTLVYLITLSLVGFFGCKDISDIKDQDIPFKKISSSYSGIEFSNTITPNLENYENLFDYDYFYNGSGVGIADINNDGLQDILFTANQKDNKLYLNKGNLKFEDITSNSGINENKGWASGITFVDINADGWLDIYISQGGPYKPSSRENVLLINNKDLTFTERSKEYGLNDGISTQSAFLITITMAI